MDENIANLYDEDFLIYVKKFCYSKINFQNHDGDDAIQGAILKIFLNQHKYENRLNCTFKTWALTVARNHCLDFVRKQQSLDKKTLRIDSLEPHVAENIAKVTFVDHLEESEERKISKEKMKYGLKKMGLLLNGVTESHRNVILLKYKHGTMAASRILKMKPNTVRAISLRVLAKLQTAMLDKKQFKSHLARVPKNVGMERFRARRAEFKRLKEEKKLNVEKRIKEVEEILKNYTWD